MPKKTKKEKLLAQVHRLPALRRLPAVSQTHISSVSPVTTAQLTYTVPPVFTTPAKTKAAEIEYMAIKQDLFKTILWSACIILGELLLSRYLR